MRAGRITGLATAFLIVGALSACGSTTTGFAPPVTSPQAAERAAEPSAAEPATTLPLFVPPLDAAPPTDGPAAQPLEPVLVDETSALPATVMSADGSSVTITDTSRIVPLWGNLSEIVFSLGLGDRVVARDSSATFGEAAGLPLVTRGHDVSAESVLSLRPTVVLAQTDTGPPEALDHIRNAGVPVLVLDTPNSVRDAVDRIALLAAALGVPGAGAALATRTQSDIDAVLADVPIVGTPPRVAFLYLRGTAGVYLLGGPGSGADSMIEAAGGVDAGTAIGLENAFTPLTSEALVLAAPDVIMMTTTGLESVGGIDGLVQIPGIAQTRAGLDRRIVTVEDGLLFSFGARTPLAIAEIVRQLHSSS